MRRLADWRKQANLTQVELAKRLGCDQSTISAIENGAAPSFKLLAQIVIELAPSPDELMAAVVGGCTDAAPDPQEAAT